MLPLLTWSAAGVAAAALGALLAPRSAVNRARLVGVASAVAAGLMLGVAYVIAQQGLEIATVPALLGAGTGLLLTHVVGHRRSCATSARIGSPGGVPAGRSHLVATHALHSASEGVAMGAAFAWAPELGALTAMALIVHNIPEGGLLAVGLTGAQGRSMAAVSALIARLPQLIVAAAVWWAAVSLDGVLAAALGFGFAALVYLALAELLPLSYAHRGRTSIALMVSVAAGVVAALGAIG
jgi:zinc transporter, ZIP family